MPGILDLVSQSLGPNAVQAISQKLGADPQQTQSAISSALPMLLAGLSQNAQSGGADAVHAAVAEHHDALDNVTAAVQNAGSGAGGIGGLLSQVLGQHQDVAQGAVANASGLAGGQAQQLLAMLAPLVMSATSRVTQQQGLNSSGLASLLQGEHQQLAQTLAQSQPQLMGLASQLLDSSQAGGLLGNLTKGLGNLLGGR